MEFIGIFKTTLNLKNSMENQKYIKNIHDDRNLIHIY